MKSIRLLALIWLCAFGIIGLARAQTCMMCGTSASKMYANPMTGVIHAVGNIITPSQTPTPTAAPTATPPPPTPTATGT